MDNTTDDFSSRKPDKTSKPDLILIHGFRGAPIGLSRIADRLIDAGYKVHTPAIPPFAGAGLLDEYTPTTYAEYIHAFLEQQKIKQPILIGHSMGATVAAAIACLFPEDVHEKLILMSPITTPPPKPFQIMTPLSAYFPRPVVDYATTSFLYVPHRNRQLFRDVMAQTKACSASTNIQRKHIHQSAKFSAKYSVENFDFPQNTLIIAGEKDRLVAKKHTKKLAERPNTQLHFLANTGHLHNYEKPHETAELILKFLLDEE